MNSVKVDFEKRKNEIQEYLAYVTVICDDNTKIKHSVENIFREEKVSDQLQKILIANGFLILYNLIEATIRNSICEIFDRIQDEGIAYIDLSESIKRIWIDQNTHGFKNGNTKFETLRDCVLSITTAIIAKENIQFAKDQINFSGNLDAKKIRTLATSYGFDVPSKNGDNLLTIKNKRNHLAHGDFTFSDIGKDYTVNDLNNFKEETFDYLEDVILKIEAFINGKSFKLVIDPIFP